jgi:hypothetical protein
MRGDGKRDFRMRREPCHCLRPAPLFAFFLERGFFLVSGAYAQQGRRGEWVGTGVWKQAHPPAPQAAWPDLVLSSKPA